jgi:hypothetical protein
VPVLENGIWQPGWLGPERIINAISIGGLQGVDVILSPEEALLFGGITIAASGYDAGCQGFSETLSFTTGCGASPCTDLANLNLELQGSWGLGSWGLSGWGKSSGQALGGTVTSSLPSNVTITPPDGLTTGSEQITITGSNVCCFAFDDAFRTGTLDPTLWIPLGIAGAVSVGPMGPTGRCHLVPPPTGGFAGIFSKALLLRGDFFITQSFTITTPYVGKLSPGAVVLAALEARFDDDNRLIIYALLPAAPNNTVEIHCQVWKQGFLMHDLVRKQNIGKSSFSIARYFDPIMNDHKAGFFVGGERVADFYDAPACDLNIRIWCQSTLPYPVSLDLERFESAPCAVMVFPTGAAVCSQPIKITTGRARFLTPRTVDDWARLVDLRLSNGLGSGCVDIVQDAFTYAFPPAFIVGRDVPYAPAKREASLTNDPQLRNPGPNIGLGLRRRSQ